MVHVAAHVLQRFALWQIFFSERSAAGSGSSSLCFASGVMGFASGSGGLGLDPLLGLRINLSGGANRPLGLKMLGKLPAEATGWGSGTGATNGAGSGADTAVEDEEASPDGAAAATWL